MTYNCTDCIIDHMAASGPQTLGELRRECSTQAVPFSPELFDLAIGELLGTGKIVVDKDDDFTYFDFPTSYYDAQLI